GRGRRSEQYRSVLPGESRRPRRLQLDRRGGTQAGRARRHRWPLPYPPRSGSESERSEVMSKFFIRRPIVAMVISILTVIIGAVVIAQLPIAQFPQIAPPEVQIKATF